MTERELKGSLRGLWIGCAVLWGLMLAVGLSGACAWRLVAGSLG